MIISFVSHVLGNCDNGDILSLCHQGCPTLMSHPLTRLYVVIVDRLHLTSLALRTFKLRLSTVLPGGRQGVRTSPKYFWPFPTELASTAGFFLSSPGWRRGQGRGGRLSNPWFNPLLLQKGTARLADRKLGAFLLKITVIEFKLSTTILKRFGPSKDSTCLAFFRRLGFSREAKTQLSVYPYAITH